jgi:diguanylate cyclase (GGDEF)-like protein/PAS domain S-box-containing protein
MRPKHSLHDAETLRMLVWNLPAGIYITTDKGEILDVNPGFLELFGVPSLDVLRGYKAEELYLDPAQRDRQRSQLERKGFVADFELQLRNPGDDRVRTVLDTCYAVPDRETGETFYHGILIDVTARRELEGQIEELTIRDLLTGCLNRRYLDQLELCLVDERSGWGAILVAVDGFRQYNVDHGYKAGDELLMRMSRFLQRQVRTEDLVIRMGSDEFLVLLVGESAPSTEAVAVRMQEQPRESSPAGFSLGWAVREDDEDMEQTLHRAELKLIQVRSRERSPRRRRRSSSNCLIPK